MGSRPGTRFAALPGGSEGGAVPERGALVDRGRGLANEARRPPRAGPRRSTQPLTAARRGPRARGTRVAAGQQLARAPRPRRRAASPGRGPSWCRPRARRRQFYVPRRSGVGEDGRQPAGMKEEHAVCQGGAMPPRAHMGDQARRCLPRCRPRRPVAGDQPVRERDHGGGAFSAATTRRLGSFIANTSNNGESYRWSTRSERSLEACDSASRAWRPPGVRAGRWPGGHLHHLDTV